MIFKDIVVYIGTRILLLSIDTKANIQLLLYLLSIGYRDTFQDMTILSHLVFPIKNLVFE